MNDLRRVLDKAPLAELHRAIERRKAMVEERRLETERLAKIVMARFKEGNAAVEFLRWAAEQFDETVGAIISHRRNEPLVTHRHIIQAAARQVLDLGYEKLGALFQRADHTALIYAVMKCGKNDTLRRQVDDLVRRWEAHCKANGQASPS